MSGFTKWLRKSGIKYQYGELAGTEMIDNLNPFEPLYNGLKASDFGVTRPAGRVFIGLFTTPINVFDAIMGDHYKGDNQGHGRKGLLDVLIIPSISRRLMAYSNDKDADYILGAAAFIVGAPLEIARHALGAALTVALTPVAYAANIVTETFSHVFNYFKNSSNEKTRSAIEAPEDRSKSSNDVSYKQLHASGLKLDKTHNNSGVNRNNKLISEEKPATPVDQQIYVPSTQVLPSAASDNYSYKSNSL